MGWVQLPIHLVANMSFPSNHIANKFKPLLSCESHGKSSKTNSSLLRLRLARSQKCGVSGNYNEETQVDELPAGLEAELMPKHVAVIMDGNRRWATNRGLPVHDGHLAGKKSLELLCRNCVKYGVRVLTVFAFSTENWIRPKEEVNFLMDMGKEFTMLQSDPENLKQYDARLSFVGRRGKLSEAFQRRMWSEEERSKDKKQFHLVVALDYGGRYDITEATKKVATKVKDGVLKVEEIDDAIFEQHLATNVIDFPNPDLLIRSSGELRISNFMLWQLAYTEMFFTKKLFPDFDEIDFVEAITAFQGRRRRFGGHVS